MYFTDDEKEDIGFVFDVLICLKDSLVDYSDSPDYYTALSAKIADLVAEDPERGKAVLAWMIRFSENTSDVYVVSKKIISKNFATFRI